MSGGRGIWSSATWALREADVRNGVDRLCEWWEIWGGTDSPHRLTLNAQEVADVIAALQELQRLAIASGSMRAAHD